MYVSENLAPPSLIEGNRGTYVPYHTYYLLYIHIIDNFPASSLSLHSATTIAKIILSIDSDKGGCRYHWDH
jgi:hypothetical protein